LDRSRIAASGKSAHGFGTNETDGALSVAVVAATRNPQGPSAWPT
jgi:hypothetical protein